MAQALVQPVEHPHNIIDPGAGSLKYRKQGFTIVNPMFVERYINFDLQVVVNVRIRGIAPDFTACFQRDGGPSDPSPDLTTILYRHFISKAKVWAGSFDVLSDSDMVEVRSMSKQQSMLISDVEFMESPQNIIPSLVWLDRTDDFLRATRKGLYFSSERGFLLWGERSLFKDGEINVSAIRPTVLNCESTSQVIERTSEIVDNVPSHKGELGRNTQILAQAIKDLSAANVTLWGNMVGVRLKVETQAFIEIKEVLVGPLDL
jgi:hypothetical protein